MDEAKLNKTLQDYGKRIKALEAVVGIGSKPSKNLSGKRLSLSDHLLTLRDKGFFSQSRTAEETHKQIQKTYACELNRVEVALVRLADGKKLRRASKIISDKTYKAYAW